MYTVAVSAYITNDKDEVLLVKSIGREDTWELPGGRVEEGETLIEAVKREVKEEANVDVEITKQIGIYQNPKRNLLIITFKGTYLKGNIKPQEGEIVDVLFQKVDEKNIEKWVTRMPIKNRIVDAMKGEIGSLEVLNYEPYEMLERISGSNGEGVKK